MASEPEYYEALIGCGVRGIGARLIGAIPREFPARRQRQLRDLIESGYWIQVLCPDQAAWQRIRPALFRQLGLAEGPRP
jgi:hypothetical protein